MHAIKKTIYIAGPMRGIPRFNFPNFDATRSKLQMMGYNVISPADEDRAIGFDPWALPMDTDWTRPELLGFDMDAAMRRCFEAIMRSDAIYMLPGWESSKGATAERAIAEWRGLEVLYHPACGVVGRASRPVEEPSTKTTGQEAHPTDTEDILDIARRITRGDRQAQYGPPDQDFCRTADMWTALKGTKFEPWEVAQFMIALKLSRETHQRKKDNAVDIAGYARCLAVCNEAAGVY